MKPEIKRTKQERGKRMTPQTLVLIAAILVLIGITVISFSGGR